MIRVRIALVVLHVSRVREHVRLVKIVIVVRSVMLHVICVIHVRRVFRVKEHVRLVSLVMLFRIVLGAIRVMHV